MYTEAPYDPTDPGDEPAQMKCPACGQTDRFTVAVKTAATVDARDLSADTDAYSDIEFGDDAHAVCGFPLGDEGYCPWEGTCAELYRAAGILIPEDDGPPAAP